jgi:hypothetical protein
MWPGSQGSVGRLGLQPQQALLARHAQVQVLQAQLHEQALAQAQLQA